MRYQKSGGRRDFGRDAPVKVGDELDVKIEAVGEKGDGVAKKDGFVLFVPGTKQGENVKIKVTRVLQKVGFAEVIGQGEASEEGTEQQQEESQEEPSEGTQSEEDYGGQDSEDFGEESEEN